MGAGGHGGRCVHGADGRTGIDKAVGWTGGRADGQTGHGWGPTGADDVKRKSYLKLKSQFHFN